MRPTLLLVAAAATLAACSESPTQVADSTPLTPPTPAFDVVSAAPVVATVTGSGHALCTDDGTLCNSGADDDALRTFSFTAQLHEDGTALGKAHFNNRGRASAWDADIECVYIRPDKPNQVWLAGTLTRGYGGETGQPSGIPNAPGVRVLFGVEDNGEGGTATAPDRITGLGTAPETDYQVLCNAPQFIPSAQLDLYIQLLGFDAIRGDIQVRPGSTD